MSDNPSISISHPVSISSVPIALMTAELGSAWPNSGGMSAWVTRACGPFLGAQNMSVPDIRVYSENLTRYISMDSSIASRWWIVVGYTLDASIYPILASDYLSNFDMLTNGMGTFQKGVYSVCVVLFVTVVKLSGRKNVSTDHPPAPVLISPV